MSHNPLNERKVKDGTPEQLREALDEYIAHVQQHDPKNIRFAIMIAGHAEADGGAHVCSMLGGSPQTLARIVTELMGNLIDRDPAFAVLFFIHQVTNEPDFDNTDDADIKAQIKDLLDKLRGDTPPNGGVH
ncbi:MAG: hypothetical protein KatS3mg015_2645 [Fimbriimonadales bacterium]|nr:MAG: hypothetical protein KatS3mg015_2645 [Fimbriimonadales bacterium]